MIIGAHVSIAGNYLTALKQTEKLGANALQIFSGPPRSWDPPQLSAEEARTFCRQAKKQAVEKIFIHAKYLINLSSENPATRERSINSLVQDLETAAALGARGVIFHPHLGNNKFLKQAVMKILSRTPHETFLIMENSAQTDLAEFIRLFTSLGPARVKLCLDTAHLFESGIDLRQPAGLEKVMRLIKTVGWKKVALIHTNDSRTGCGSKHDVHENISQGQLGISPFLFLANHPQTKNLPFILETPAGKDNLDEQKKNIDRFRNFAGHRLTRSFYRRETTKVARRLLGKLLVFMADKKLMMGIITETEAYLGPEDLACHSAKGRTARTEPMYGRPGTSYLYLIYGKYHCLNLVTEKTNFPAAVLIRVVRAVYGTRNKTDGPGKVCREYGLTRRENNLDTVKSNRLYVKDIGLKPEKIMATPRIGVDYAGKWAKKKLRFVSRTLSTRV